MKYRMQFDPVMFGPALADNPEGWIWDVVLIRPGLCANSDPRTGLPLNFSREFLATLIPALEGARVFADHAAGGSSGSVRQIIGYVDGVRADDTGALRGNFHLLRSEEWAQQKLKAAADAGKLDMFGMSLAAFIRFEKARVNGREVLDARAIDPSLPLSVDLVTFPAAGGALLRAVAGMDPTAVPNSSATRSTGATTMTERFAAFLAKLRKLAGEIADPQNQTRIAAIETELALETPNIESALAQATEILASIQTPQTQGHGPEARATTPDLGPIRTELAAMRTESAALRTQLEQSQASQRIAESLLLLNTQLDASRLPAPLQADIRRRFTGAAPTAEQITAEIKAVREAYAAVVPGPHRVGGAAYVEVGRTGFDRMQIALDRMLGVTHQWNEVREGQAIRMERGAEVARDVPAFRSVREAYIAFTGDTDVSGRVVDEMVRRITLDWNNAGFPNALGSTLHRQLLQSLNEVDYGVQRLITVGRATDFKPNEKVRVGYLGDIPDVDPEAAAYAKITAPTDEKASLTVGQKGVILPITRKMIINDDIGAVQQMISRLGRSARRTLAQFITDFFIANAAIYDAKAWFHADHVNLGTTALSIAELAVIRAAFDAFAEKDSAKKLGLEPMFLMVPTALRTTGLFVNAAEYVTDSLADRSTVRWMFGDNEKKPQNLIVNPLLADANDYYVIGDPAAAPVLEIDFLDGRVEPEFFLADNPAVGAVFTNDEIQYKLRHEYGGAVVDFRNVYKEVVA